MQSSDSGADKRYKMTDGLLTWRSFYSIERKYKPCGKIQNALWNGASISGIVEDLYHSSRGDVLDK